MYRYFYFKSILHQHGDNKNESCLMVFHEQLEKYTINLILDAINGKQTHFKHL